MANVKSESSACGAVEGLSLTRSRQRKHGGLSHRKPSRPWLPLLAFLLAAGTLAASAAWAIRHAEAPALPEGQADGSPRGGAALRRAETDRLFQQAEAALKRGDPAAAELFEAVLSRDPAHPSALLYHGEFARERGNVDAALADWRKVDDESPVAAGTARYLEGTVLLERGRARDAERLFLRAGQLHPRYVQPHARLLELYAVQARRNDVRLEIDRIGALRPWTLDELIFRLVPPEEATTPDAGAALMRSYLAAEPDDVNSVMAAALYEIKAERHAAAAVLLEPWRAQLPNEPRIAALAADAALGSGDVEAARALLAQFPTAAGSPAALWRSHAHLAAAQADWTRAAACLSAVVQAEPEDAASLYRLGTVLRHLGRAEDSQRSLERGELLDRTQREALRLIWGDRSRLELRLPILLTVAANLAELGYPVEAARWFEQALAIHPGEPAAIAGLQAAAASYAADPALPQQSDPFGPPAGYTSDAAARVLAEAATDDGAAAQTVSGQGVSALAAKTQVTQPAAAMDVADIRLSDVAAAAQLEFAYFNGQTGFKHLVESMGGGVGVVDLDADGWPDLYFPQGCALPHSPTDTTHLDRLYRNRGDGTFVDVTAAAGIVQNRYGQGIAVGDYDGDGFADIAVANYGRNTLLRNNGDGTFTDATQDAGLADPDEMSSSLALADLDSDGLADLYVANYVANLKVCPNPDGTYNSCRPSNFDARQDRLYHNRGDGTLEDLTQASGIVVSDGKGLGVLVADLDDDGRPDVYVANDTTPNFLFRNTSEPGRPAFVEEGLITGTAVSEQGRSQAGMGIASGDFDGDGTTDLYVTNFQGETNALYLNAGGVFTDATRHTGVAEATFGLLGFGTQAADFNLDGRPDLFITNGHIDDFRSQGEPWQMPPLLFAGRGDGRFAEVSRAAGDYFSGSYLGRGVARLDYNLDGRPDLVVVHQDRPVGLLRNDSPAGHAAVFDLRGTTASRDAVGATLRVTAGGVTQRLDVTAGDGFFASNEKRQCVGLGQASRIDRLEIRWPGGAVERWTDLPADVRLLCVQGRRPRVLPLSVGPGQRL